MPLERSPYSRLSSVQTDDGRDDYNLSLITDSNEFSSYRSGLSAAEIDKINELIYWLPTDAKVVPTDFEQIYPYWWEIIIHLISKFIVVIRSKLISQECCSTQPVGDQYIYEDLRKYYEHWSIFKKIINMSLEYSKMNR